MLRICRRQGLGRAKHTSVQSSLRWWERLHHFVGLHYGAAETEQFDACSIEKPYTQRAALYGLVLLCVFFFSACSELTPAQRVAAAVEMYECERFEDCRKLCDDILADSSAFSKLQVSDLCTLSELYITMPGNSDESDVEAARCIARARDINPDSVDMYVANYASEVAQRMYVLDRVGSYLEIPRDSLSVEDEEYQDTIINKEL